MEPVLVLHVGFTFRTEVYVHFLQSMGREGNRDKKGQQTRPKENRKHEQNEPGEHGPRAIWFLNKL